MQNNNTILNSVHNKTKNKCRKNTDDSGQAVHEELRDTQMNK